MSHLLTTRNPQSEARRQAVHGPIEPAYNPRFPAVRVALAAIPAAYFAMHFVMAWFGA